MAGHVVLGPYLFTCHASVEALPQAVILSFERSEAIPLAVFQHTRLYGFQGR